MSKVISYEFLEPGYKLMVVHRRLYKEDQSRYFIGTVDAFNEKSGLLRMTGHTWAKSHRDLSVTKKEQARTKILALNSGTIIVYVLPMETRLDKLQFVSEVEGRVWLRDGQSVNLDMSETA